MRRFLPLFALCAAVTWATALFASSAAAAAASGPVTLAVQAVVAQGARKPVAGPVMWSVVRLMDDKNPGAIVASATEAAPKFSLPPGHYLVTAKLGEAEAKQPVELTSAPVKLIVNLDAGVLRVNLIPYAGAKPVTDPVHWELLTYARDAGAQTRVTEANAAATEFILPAGSYVLRAEYQGTHAELVVPLEAGQTFNYTLNLYAGKARATAVSEKGAAFKDPVVWEVVRAADRTLVSADTAPAPQFTLREGRYVLLGRQGNYAGEAPFEVKAGKSSTVKVTLKSLPPEQIAALEKASSERKAQAAAALAPKAPAATTVAAARPAAPAAAASGSLEPSTTRSLAETMKLAEEAQQARTADQPAAAPAPADAAAPAPAAPASDAATPALAMAAPAPGTEAAPVAEQPPAPVGKGAVRFSAWSKVVAKFRDPVEWEVRRVQPNGAVLPELVASQKAASPKLSLPAGSYVVWGRQGTLIGKQRFDVEPDKTVAIRVFMQTPMLTERAATAATTTATSAAPEGVSTAEGG